MSRKANKSNKKKLAAVLLGTLLLVFFVFVIFSIKYHGEMTPVGNPDTEAPNISARAAVLYSMDLDEVVYSKNADNRYAPYSITKLVTAYIAANNLDMNQEVEISKFAADDDPMGSTMFLEEGEKVTVEQLLYGALLLSGNDAATALAEATSGDIGSFIDLMNKTVQEWGCENTQFANPTGWREGGHYTSANDLLIIMQHALGDEKISKIAFTKKYNMPHTNKHRARKMKNHTPYIHRDNSGVLGGKTGYWDLKNCTVALEYNKNELSAMMILLKDSWKGRNKDIKKLSKYAHEAIPGYRVDSKGRDTGKTWVKGGKKTHVHTYLSETTYAYPKNGSKMRVKVRIKYETLEAPVSKGTPAGKYNVYCNGNLVASKDILLAEDVEEGMILSNIFISDRAGVTIILIILVLTLAVILLRIYNKKKVAKRRSSRKA